MPLLLPGSFLENMIVPQIPRCTFNEDPRIIECLGPTPWTIAFWVKQADRDAGHGDGGLTTSEREELARLRRGN